MKFSRFRENINRTPGSVLQQVFSKFLENSNRTAQSVLQQVFSKFLENLNGIPGYHLH